MLKSHTCENTVCKNKAEKDRYGNYKRYCSAECKKVFQLAKMQTALANKDMNAIAEKRKATNIARYGVANVAQTDSVRDKLRVTSASTADIRTAKTRETNLRNYGVESTNSLQSVKDKKKASFIEKHGVDHQLKIPEVAASVARKNSENAKERLAVAAQTKLDLYGDENYNNRIKYIDTCIEKFGVENPSQNAVVHEYKVKRMYSSKDYIFPSGKVVKIQGWENKALDELLITYHENDICTVTTDIPRITYFDETGKQHYYFPDIYIPKENLLIEVKSHWTYNKNIPRYNLKKDACISQGYNFRLMIY